MDTPAERNVPEREDLLKAIDFEIERVTAEHQKPGWTEWAIFGALAVVFWAIVSFPYSNSLSLVATAQILLTMYLVYDSLGAFRLLYDVGKNENSMWLTFHKQAYRISPRANFAQVSIRLFLLVVAWIGLPTVWWPCAAVVFVWLIGSLASSIYSFRLWFEDQPLSLFNPPNPRRWLSLGIGFLVALIVTLVVLWAVSGYLRAAVIVSDPAELADQFKLAGLVFAVVFLFERMFFEPRPQRVLDDLVEIRRAYFFGEIDSEHAQYNLKKLLGRLSPKEFIDGLYENYQEALNRYEWTIERATEWLFAQNEEVAGSIEGLASVQTDASKRESLRIFGSKQELALRDTICADEEKAFNKDFHRAKRFLSFELDEFTEVEKDIESRKMRIDEKLQKLRSVQARLNTPIESQVG